jgi:hypothetical protein
MVRLRSLKPALAGAVLILLGTMVPQALAWGTAHYSVPKSKMDRALACKGGKAGLDGSGKFAPVLLVHGTGVTRAQNWKWNYWGALPAAGFEVCWVELPKYALDDLQISAEYVARAIQVMHKKSHERIDILGHSQGGLVPRWALKYFPSARHVGDYIGLASPNHGTTVADGTTTQGQAPPAVWQMRRNARFVTALNKGDETPGRINYTDIYTRTDELVEPVGTQALKGGVNILLQDLCPQRNVDHAAIAGDGLTYELVMDALKHHGPARVKRLPADHCSATTVPGSSAPPPGATPDYTRDRLTDHEPKLKPYAR